MDKYIKRLIRCSYTEDKAYRICCDFITNLSLFDLECFVASMERKNVEKV